MPNQAALSFLRTALEDLADLLFLDALEDLADLLFLDALEDLPDWLQVFLEDLGILHIPVLPLVAATEQ
jgi:hypothetical protein